jgi:hypothetical protein
MFTRLAKSGLASLGLVKSRLVQPQSIAPAPLRAAGLSNNTYSNDNLPGFRRPAAAGKRRSPTPALACHWFDRDGRLECRWRPGSNDAPTGSFNDHEHATADRISGSSSIRPRGLTLAG